MYGKRHRPMSTLSMNQEPVLVGRPITLEALAQVARRGRAVAFDSEARARVVRSRLAIDAITSAGDTARASMA